MDTTVERRGSASIEGLLGPELLLPSQLPTARQDGFVSGERALRVAVLEDAIRCLETPGRGGGCLAREAEAWVRADEREWPFSFVAICEALDLEPDGLRAALLARAARHRHPVPARGDDGPRYRLHLRLKPPRARIGSSLRRMATSTTGHLRAAALG